MDQYIREELVDALRVVSSTISKCEKMNGLSWKMCVHIMNFSKGMKTSFDKNETGCDRRHFLGTFFFKEVIHMLAATYHACGVRNMNAKERYVEILRFQHFARYMTFTTDGDDFRNKVLKDKIDVSVVLDMECVDMFTQCFK